jgi:rhamnosyltransferase
MPDKTIGIVGARGIGNYGGYERMLVDLVPRLVQKGYRVRCSCEQPERGEGPCEYIGATLDYFPLKAPANYSLRKAFELFYDSYFIAKYSLFCDIVYVLGIYGGPSLLFPRLWRKEVIINTDGLEWERAKYHVVERSIIIWFYGFSLNLATKIVVDNEQMKQYIGTRHRPKTFYIPYGVSPQKPEPWDESRLSSYTRKNASSARIIKDKYWLVIARLEPCNNIHIIIDGFKKASPKYPLIIVGDFTSNKYRMLVNHLGFGDGSAEVIFMGAIYDPNVLAMLRQHCLAYIHGHSVGGTNPSLLEAMISKNLILAYDNPFNRELCGKFAYYFTNSTDVSDLVTLVEQSSGPVEFRSEVYNRAVEAYSWEHVTALYDKIFANDGETGSTQIKAEAVASHENQQ